MGVPKTFEKIPDFFEKNRKKSGVPKKSEKITDFLKIREKKSGGTKNTRNSRSQGLVTLGRDKTQRNPSLNFKGNSFVLYTKFCYPQFFWYAQIFFRFFFKKSGIISDFFGTP